MAPGRAENAAAARRDPAGAALRRAVLLVVVAASAVRPAAAASLRLQREGWKQAKAPAPQPALAEADAAPAPPLTLMEVYGHVAASSGQAQAKPEMGMELSVVLGPADDDGNLGGKPLQGVAEELRMEMSVPSKRGPHLKAWLAEAGMSGSALLPLPAIHQGVVVLPRFKRETTTTPVPSTTIPMTTLGVLATPFPPKPSVPPIPGQAFGLPPTTTEATLESLLTTTQAPGATKATTTFAAPFEGSPVAHSQAYEIRGSRSAKLHRLESRTGQVIECHESDCVEETAGGPVYIPEPLH